MYILSVQVIMYGKHVREHAREAQLSIYYIYRLCAAAVVGLLCKLHVCVARLVWV
jgi:hypothetical protein